MASLTMKQKFNALKGLSVRNIKVFFKDRATVFFSILAPLIVFGLYILFIRDAYMDSIVESLKDVKDYVNMDDVANIGNTWLLSGILSTSCITVSLNSLSIMVSDKERKVDYDYNSSPCSGPIVVVSYFIGAFLNTLLITSAVLTVGLIVLSAFGNLYLSALNIVSLYLVTIIGCASSTILMMVIVSFFKTGSALGAFGGIVSAVVGFAVGAYVPLGNFSDTIRSCLTLIPGSNIAALYRDILMSGVIDSVGNSMGQYGGAEFVKDMSNVFSLSLKLFNYDTTQLFSYIYATASIVVGLAINILLYKKTSKRN